VSRGRLQEERALYADVSRAFMLGDEEKSFVVLDSFVKK